jgi:pSer/pThr/pTyr-binding forkhead associated (FHA) protein
MRRTDSFEQKQRMVVRLVIEQGRRRRVFSIREPGGVLGRARGCAIRIPSAEISRRHCRLRLEDGLVYVEDLDSVNGTLLNGEPVYEKTLVRPGDRLEVGPVGFVVEYELTPEALERLREQFQCDEVLQAVDEDLPEVQRVEEDPEQEIPTLEPVGEAEPVGEGLEVDLSFADQPWEMPEGDDLRDILSRMEDGDQPDEDDRPRRRR